MAEISTLLADLDGAAIRVSGFKSQDKIRQRIAELLAEVAGLEGQLSGNEAELAKAQADYETAVDMLVAAGLSRDKVIAMVSSRMALLVEAGLLDATANAGPKTETTTKPVESIPPATEVTKATPTVTAPVIAPAVEEVVAETPAPAETAQAIVEVEQPAPETVEAVAPQSGSEPEAIEVPAAADPVEEPAPVISVQDKPIGRPAPTNSMSRARRPSAPAAEPASSTVKAVVVATEPDAAPHEEARGDQVFGVANDDEVEEIPPLTEDFLTGEPIAAAADEVGDVEREEDEDQAPAYVEDAPIVDADEPDLSELPPFLR